MYYSPMMNAMPYYEIRDLKVFFGHQYLPEATWSDFEDLGQGYGKDGQHVFYMGQLIPNAHPSTFQMIDDICARDDQYVFQYGQIVQNLQSQSFQPSTTCTNESMIIQNMSSMYPTSIDAAPTQMSSYEIQDFKVFFDNQYVPDARWIDFTNLGQGYGKDIHHVYYMGQMIENAHAFSFEVLKKGYAKDKNYVFHNGKIVDGLEPCGFETF